MENFRNRRNSRSGQCPPDDTGDGRAGGRGTAFIFKNEKRRHRIVIGKDIAFGYMLENALVPASAPWGGRTPGGPLLPGIASSLPPCGRCGNRHFRFPQPLPGQRHQDFFRRRVQAPDQLEDRIEDLSFEQIASLRPRQEVGKAFRIDDAVGRYRGLPEEFLSKQFTLEG